MATPRKPRVKGGVRQYVTVKPHTRSPRGPNGRKPRPRVKPYKRRFPGA